MPTQPSPPAGRPAVPEGMALYYLGTLRGGPAWAPLGTPEVDRLHGEHLAYLRRLHEAGSLLLYGPILDGGDLRGVSVFKAGSLEEVLALGQADPAVRAGRLIFEAHPWMTQAGILP